MEFRTTRVKQWRNTPNHLLYLQKQHARSKVEIRLLKSKKQWKRWTCQLIFKLYFDFNQYGILWFKVTALTIAAMESGIGILQEELVKLQQLLSALKPKQGWRWKKFANTHNLKDPWLMHFAYISASYKCDFASEVVLSGECFQNSQVNYKWRIQIHFRKCQIQQKPKLNLHNMQVTKINIVNIF